MKVRFRRLRQRFGIAAPQVAVRSHVPWYWRWLGIGALVGLCAALAFSIYDAGRRFAGYDSMEATRQLSQTRDELDASRSELARLRVVADAAGSRLSIEHTAQEELTRQLRSLEAENAQLREQLGTLESMLSSDAANPRTLSIYSFKVEPGVLPGEYRYRVLLLTPRTAFRKDFEGRIELSVFLTDGDRNAMMSFPQKDDPRAEAFSLDFKYFRRVEGTFRVAPEAKVQSVQVRVYEKGYKDPKATQSARVS